MQKILLQVGLQVREGWLGKKLTGKATVNESSSSSLRKYTLRLLSVGKRN